MAAARVVLARSGAEGLTLEAVAREAGVAPTLPRHYFGSAERLWVLTVQSAVREVTAPLIDRRPLSMRARLEAYVEHLSQAAWGHALWMHSAAQHPEIDAEIRDTQRTLMEAAFGRKWATLSEQERLVAMGWLGACNAMVELWIDNGCQRPELLVEELERTGARFGLPDR